MEQLQYIDPATIANSFPHHPDLAKQQKAAVEANNQRYQEAQRKFKNGVLISSKQYQQVAKAQQECATLRGKVAIQEKAMKATTDALATARQDRANAEPRMAIGGMDDFLDATSEIERLSQVLSKQVVSLKSAMAELSQAEKNLQQAKNELVALYQKVVGPLADQLNVALKTAESLNSEIDFLSSQVRNVVDVEEIFIAGGFLAKWSGLKKQFDAWMSGKNEHHMAGLKRAMQLWK